MSATGPIYHLSISVAELGAAIDGCRGTEFEKPLLSCRNTQNQLMNALIRQAAAAATPSRPSRPSVQRQGLRA